MLGWLSEALNLVLFLLRTGKLTMIDFVKSVDTVYKESKLLRASVKNSERIDRAFERVINVGFYALLFIFTLPQLGFEPLAVFLSMSSIIVGFAFMVGPAASKMFEGWLFILLRRPYDIGDRIHIAMPNTDPGSHGCASWFVRDVDLFTTTVVFGGTGEKATLNNGSLAMYRVRQRGLLDNVCFALLLNIFANHFCRLSTWLGHQILASTSKSSSLSTHLSARFKFLRKVCESLYNPARASGPSS